MISQSTTSNDDGNLIIPSNITEINKCSYMDNKEITSVTIPSSIKHINRHAFNHTKNLKTVNFNNGLEVIDTCSFTSTGITELLFPQSLKIISDNAFALCEQLKSISINNQLITIGAEAFWGCTSLTGDIVFPESIQHIGSGAFAFTNILSAKISDNVKILSEKLFYGCPSLKDIHLHDNIEEIKPYIFTECCIGINVHMSKKIFRYIVLNDILAEWKSCGVKIRISN